MEVCSLFSTDGFLLGGSVFLPTPYSHSSGNTGLLSDVVTGTVGSSECESTVRGRYLHTLLQCSSRFGTFQVTGDPCYGDVLSEGFSVCFYRTEGERSYGRRLKAILQDS